MKIQNLGVRGQRYSALRLNPYVLSLVPYATLKHRWNDCQGQFFILNL